MQHDIDIAFAQALSTFQMMEESRGGHAEFSAMDALGNYESHYLKSMTSP